MVPIGKIKRLDPNGLLLPVGIASDGTELCKEQSVTPMYIVNNALPLDEKRKRIHWILVRSCDILARICDILAVSHMRSRREHREISVYEI